VTNCSKKDVLTTQKKDTKEKGRLGVVFGADVDVYARKMPDWSLVIDI